MYECRHPNKLLPLQQKAWIYLRTGMALIDLISLVPFVDAVRRCRAAWCTENQCGPRDALSRSSGPCCPTPAADRPGSGEEHREAPGRPSGSTRPTVCHCPACSLQHLQPPVAGPPGRRSVDQPGFAVPPQACIRNGRYKSSYELHVPGYLAPPRLVEPLVLASPDTGGSRVTGG